MKVNTYHIIDLGLIQYGEAYQLQKRYLEKVRQDQSDTGTVLLCEHSTVLTLGRSAHEENILIAREQIKKQGVDIEVIDRGGDITLHAPGQLVVYPILNLRNYGKDLRRYLRKLEQVAIDLLVGFDIVATRITSQTGVWVGNKKIASIGIGVRHWVSFHGLAINVNTDLNLFSMIRPCGLDVKMTSMAEIKGHKFDMNRIKELFVKSFQNEFSNI